ncbi:hypothetical protein QYM36_007913 [Artemia franciscana]|uniref:Uncharacterized protein n=2 Tax=Artemia franciscana TaxID=6661 RepID=A0AA88IEJ6_ARTSF|nr:hypothetical protein QYM36_007913 [Artemia franciscana]
MNNGKFEDASKDLEFVLRMEPLNQDAISIHNELKDKIVERKKQIEQFKDIANMILKPFGWSTDNFIVNKDQTTNSYSISINSKKPSDNPNSSQ